MKKIILSIAFLLLYSNLLSQTVENKYLTLDDNNTSLLLLNNSTINSLEWKGLQYLSQFGIFVSAEVIDSNGDTLHISSDSFISSSFGDYDPSGMIKWGWLPTDGFSNPMSDEIANSNNPQSWPANWDNWVDEFGLGNKIANNEAYFVMNDYSNAEFEYYPSNTNSLMRGLGLSSEVRVYQFGGGLKDAIIIKYFLTNTGTKSLQKVYFGIQSDPSIGGRSDAWDDNTKIIKTLIDTRLVKKELANNTVYTFDQDGIGAGGLKPGYLSYHFVETPDNKGLTSFNVPTLGQFRPKEDELMWTFFNSGIDTVNYFYDSLANVLVNIGTGPFSLNPNETKTVSFVLFLSDSYSDMLEDATYIGLHYNWPLVKNDIASNGGEEKYKIKLNPIPSVISGDYNITWDYTGNSIDAKIFLEYSNNKGGDWYPLSVELEPNGYFTWNTTDIDDGVNYILRAVAYDVSNPKEYYYDVSASRFTIDNATFNAKPELQLMLNFVQTTVTENLLPINWISEDADNNQLEITIEYSLGKDGPFIEINKGDYPSGVNSYLWDVKEFPNAQNYCLRIKASDGEKDSTLISQSFSIDIFQNIVSSTLLESYQGNGTPSIKLQVVDNTQLKNDEYSILFHVSDLTKTFDIKNISTNQIIINNYSIDENISTPLFDGMKITIKDHGNDIDYTKTRFKSNNSRLLDYVIEFPPSIGANKIKLENDYVIVFNDPDTLDDGSWAYPVSYETLIGTVLTPFSFWNIQGNAPNFDIMEPATFVLYEPNPNTQQNGRFDWGEKLILQPQGTTDPIVSYQISFNIQNNIYPQSGDSLFIITYNELEDGDEFRFTPDSNFLVNIKDSKTQKYFSLLNNYPNPFNPSTNIRFEIPNERKVLLTVYDVLGQEVTRLINQILKAGYH